MKLYDHKHNDIKWQNKWREENIYATPRLPRDKKAYILDMFPYPSGEGLHVGHPKGYIATDIYSRFKRMNGVDVLHPMGWDAFGLPAEQFALKHKIQPSVAVKKNVSNFKQQLSHIGCDYDWDREINTTDPEFYKWTQWIFTKLYEKGLAYESNEPINWCPTCKTGLANEDLNGTLCERCDSVVEKKPIRQWVLKITEYADRMLSDLDTLNWPEGVKTAQKNWIGRSEGAEFNFLLTDVKDHEDGQMSVTVFTTRPDTLFGVTFVAISAETAKYWLDAGWDTDSSVKEYVDITLEEQKKENDYTVIQEKTGVFTGIYAINPSTKNKVPVWVANYVLGGVGTGAIMAVPAHDERDFEFAKKYKLPITEVISISNKNTENVCVTEEGVLVNSDVYTSLSSKEAKIKITEDFGGKKVVKYKIQDWVFARQRYWGEPFPVVRDEHGKVYMVDESELPVLLPEVESYEPTGTGESPLAGIKEWTHIKGFITEKGTFKSYPEGKLFIRETNTMPQWAGSSWYYLRFLDSKNKDMLIDPSIEKAWGQVDVYVGGDHATRHLIYARFWHKFLYDIGVVTTQEPFARLEFLGFILAEDGRKMSKRWGNIINPDDVVAEYGADTLRVYEMFMAPFEQTAAWSTSSIKGSDKFLDRVYSLREKISTTSTVVNELHKTIKKVTEDIEKFKFNTAISQMMILLNAMESGSFTKDEYLDFIKILAPFAPHLTEEIWNTLGNTGTIHLSSWPVYNSQYLVTEEVTMALQIGGKMRGTFVIKRDSSDEEVISSVKKQDMYKKYVGDTPVKKVIVIQNRLVNIII
ncbi:MAG: leucine--tRNA ligase [Candidatus Pacebacteria bacterium]|nr:leucine--tRNA ligase [Candidatus Paceibacterota bacterium]MBP9867206.1 leucine--tRNA ligase [Candidatus Paceibacterota bacterium]